MVKLINKYIRPACLYMCIYHLSGHTTLDQAHPSSMTVKGYMCVILINKDACVLHAHAKQSHRSNNIEHFLNSEKEMAGYDNSSA